MIRELISMQEQSRFTSKSGKGGHRNFLHPFGIKVTISGKLGNDALKYQEKEVKSKIAEAKK